MRVNTEECCSRVIPVGVGSHKFKKTTESISNNELKLHNHPHRDINTSMRSGSYLKPNALNIEKIVPDCSHVQNKHLMVHWLSRERGKK